MSGRGKEHGNRISNVIKETPKMKAANRLPRRHGAFALLVACCALALAALAPAGAQADEIGLGNFDVTATNADGTPATQAGSHPFAFTTEFKIDYTEEGVDPVFGVPLYFISAQLKDLLIDQAPGFLADTTVYPRCTAAQFAGLVGAFSRKLKEERACPNDTAVGVVGNGVFFPWLWTGSAVYNMVPPPGALARFGFRVAEAVNVVIDITVQDTPPYNGVAKLLNTSQIARVFYSEFQLWGNPSDPAHDKVRGACYRQEEEFNPFAGPEAIDWQFKPSSEACEVAPRDALLTLPASCRGPQLTAFEANSWEEPGSWISGGSLSHDDAEPPSPQGFTGCEKVSFSPAVKAKPTTDSAETGTGLDVNIEFDDEGLKDPKGTAQSQAKKVVVTLPEGMTLNPSAAEGLGVCTPADLDRETLGSQAGEGCPSGSKLGTVRVESPLAPEPVLGNVYLAQQDDPATSEPGAENPFDSLIAFHIVIRNKNLGLLVKIPARVDPDPVTGQLVTTVEEAPQLPFSSFQFHFNEGLRAPLISPPACGEYQTKVELYPWSDPSNPRTVLSGFEITAGVGEGPCPPGGIPPFGPDFEAGSLNNNAGSYSPFTMRLLRADGEQNMTKFSAVLPPGVVGSLRGVEKCADSAIGAAKAKTGREELATPSCPPNSQIGTTQAGAGVGSALTYVGGTTYLGGPYKGAPLSVISITPAVAGPFDAGTVVVRLGLDLDPKTAEVEVDGAASDPIPHILKGIPLKLRDLQVNVDRPNFTLNPTSCDESSAKATLFGSYLNLFDPADDVPADLATRYQAANCLNLGFAPKLGLKLKGGTRRGNFPGLKAHYKPFSGHANVKDLVVRLPRSAFLEQGHIRTICTRVQFAADSCPKAAQYGYIRAWTPLLDEPLQGPVYLRSSNHKLPDLVFDLHGLVDVEVQTRIDSVRGGIRARVENAPDAPISRVILNMQGGKKGLIVNSRNLCTKNKARANARFTAQSGKQLARKPVLRPQCRKRRKAKRARHSRVAGVTRSSIAG
ncbi:MAG TPA: hypothetical protein VFT19_10950 [Solirubrobacterales bacterium]|nr:hypothetical protein [Solirubrobacterales bacterium]